MSSRGGFRPRGRGRFKPRGGGRGGRSNYREERAETTGENRALKNQDDDPPALIKLIEKDRKERGKAETQLQILKKEKEERNMVKSGKEKREKKLHEIVEEQEAQRKERELLHSKEMRKIYDEQETLVKEQLNEIEQSRLSKSKMIEKIIQNCN